MAFSIFSSLSTKILAPINTAADMAGTMVAWVTPFFLLGITIQLIMYGLDVIRGAGGNQYLLDALAKVARPFLVLNIALAAGMYTATVVPFFAELRTDLSSALGAKGANSYAVIDGAMENVLSTFSQQVPYMDSKISFLPPDASGIIMYACMGVVVLAMLFYCALASINLVVIDASLAIVIGLGPLFIACFAWQATARFFDSWLSTMLKYVLTGALIAMVIGLANGLVSKLAAGIKGGTSLDYISLAAASVATAFVLVALLVKAPAIAADLVGGIGMNLAGPMQAARAVMTGGSAAASAAGGAARAGSFAAGAAAGPAGRAASAAASTPLGARVLKATESMRAQASSAATTTTTAARNFGNAMSGVAADGTKGHGAANAFRMGRQTTSGSSGTGTINGAGNGVRPVPKAEWRD